MSYIEGFVIPVPTDKKESYRKLAAAAAPIFREYGALRIVECWGTDLASGNATDFKKAAQAKTDENVVFSWVVWPSKEARDEGNRKIMSDERLSGMDMPFDGGRIVQGGFEVLLDTDE